MSCTGEYYLLGVVFPLPISADGVLGVVGLEGFLGVLGVEGFDGVLGVLGELPPELPLEPLPLGTCLVIVTVSFLIITFDLEGTGFSTTLVCLTICTG